MEWLIYSKGNPSKETGFQIEVINYVWTKYSESLKLNPRYFYLGLCFMHSKVKWQELSRFLGVSHFTFSKKIIPTLAILANNLNEIHWEDRLDYSNHVPFFPVFFTGIVDTVPIIISQPELYSRSRYFFNPKYKACVVKFQIVISFLGHIIHFSGPHLGISSDCVIWREYGPQLDDWEWIIGDGAYVAEAQMLTPFRHKNKQPLNNEEIYFNALLSHYRARVEHVNAILKSHGIFQGNFRSSINLLTIVVRVLLQFSNVHLKMFPKYEPYGNWSHI